MRQDAAHLETEEAVHTAHPLRVALGEVVVDSDHMNTLAREGVEVRRQRRHQRLTLTSAHFGDVAEVESCPTHELNVVVPLAQGAPRSFSNGGEGFRQQHVERLTVGVALLVLVGQGSKFGVGVRLEVGLQGVDLGRDSSESLDDAAFAGAQDLVENGHRPIVGDAGVS